MNVLQKRFYLYSAVFIVLIAVMFVLHLGTGFADLSYVDLARILLGGGTAEENMTVFDFRMVRSVLALLIGAGLLMIKPGGTTDLIGCAIFAAILALQYTRVKKTV